MLLITVRTLVLSVRKYSTAPSVHRTVVTGAAVLLTTVRTLVLSVRKYSTSGAAIQSSIFIKEYIEKADYNTNIYGIFLSLQVSTYDTKLSCLKDDVEKLKIWYYITRSSNNTRLCSKRLTFQRWCCVCVINMHTIHCQAVLLWLLWLLWLLYYCASGHITRCYVCVCMVITLGTYDVKLPILLVVSWTGFCFPRSRLRILIGTQVQRSPSRVSPLTLYILHTHLRLKTY